MATVTKLPIKPKPMPKAAQSAVRMTNMQIRVGDEMKRIPMSQELKARFEELFKRDLPSELQRRRMRALRRLMEAAYIAGANAE